MSHYAKISTHKAIADVTPALVPDLPETTAVKCGRRVATGDARTDGRVTCQECAHEEARTFNDLLDMIEAGELAHATPEQKDIILGQVGRV